MKRWILLLVLSAVMGIAYYGRSALSLIACTAYAHETDPPGVRTDGLCYFTYLLDTGGDSYGQRN